MAPAFAPTSSTTDAPPGLSATLAREQATRELSVTIVPDAGWDAFIAKLIHHKRITMSHGESARSIWLQLWIRLGARLASPLTQLTAEGAVQIAWGQGRHYLDVDIYPDGTMGWFYKDRERGRTAGTEDERVDEIPAALLEKLHVVAGT